VTARPEGARASPRTLAAYGSIYILVMVMFMNFATDVLLVSPRTVGMIFFLAKCWDAISDPVVGYWSDRTRSPIGRRRSWMLGSILPVGLFSVMLWAPPVALEGAALVGWLSVGVVGFYTAFTIFVVPHMALGAELSSDTRERNRIFGVRQVAVSVGMLLAFGLGAPLLEKPEGAREAAAQLIWIAALLTMLIIAIGCANLPRERLDYVGRGAQSPLKALRDVWANRHARLLLFVFFIETFGIGSVSAMSPYVVKYVIKVEGVLGMVLLFYTLPAVLSIPVWVWLGGRFERHRVWLFAMGLSCVGYGALLFQSEGRVWLMCMVSLITGTAQGCGATLGQAIKADVIDYDEYETSERKEGAYFATWNFVAKLASGMMMALAGIALDWSGFEPGVEQSALTRYTILGVMGGVPLVCFLVGMAAFTRFRLTRSMHGEIRAEIERRSQH